MRVRLFIVLFLLTLGICYATGWSLPTLSLQAEASSSNESATSNFVVDFEIRTRVNANEDRMHLQSEIVIPGLIESIFGTAGSDSDCLRSILGSSDLEICEVRLLNISALEETTEFSIAAKVAQVERNIVAQLSVTYQGSVQLQYLAALPTSVEFVYPLEGSSFLTNTAC